MSSKPNNTTVRLTERDYRVLDALGQGRFLSIPQLQALFFPSKGAATSRLRALHQAELVVRVFCPARPYDRSVQTIYALRARGARLLAERTGRKRPPHLTERERRSGLFLDHTLRRNDVRVCLERLDRELPEFRLLVWRHEPKQICGAAEVRVRKGRYERIRFVPDGYFAIRHRGRFEAFAVEIDMGTVALKRMALRYRAYWRWWKDGGMRARYGDVPTRVLTLTTTDRRLEALRSAALKAPDSAITQGSRLFWFAKLAAADIQLPETLLCPAWRVATPGGEEPRPLLDS